MPVPRANPANNRIDLPGKVPVMAAPDQAYGRVTAQQQSQKMLPVAAPPTSTPAAPQPAGGPSPAGGAPVQPGSLPFLDPTTHGLPMTHGRPYGPGAGPEALGPRGQQWQANQATEQGTLQSLLRGMAAAPGSSSLVKSLAQAAGAG